jgi:N-acyl-D-aspartate/D-glutamate deacylase
MGNCGVGIAPCRPEAREIAMRDLVNVEAIPFEVLNSGITWDWETFPQYLDAAARRKSALNLALLAPLTPFRHYVMGEASMEREANEEETKKIKALLGEAMDAGAFGFSSTLLNQHLGFQGRPLACRKLAEQSRGPPQVSSFALCVCSDRRQMRLITSQDLFVSELSG